MREVTASSSEFERLCTKVLKCIREPLREEFVSRKAAKAQRKPFRYAVALCALAPLRESSSLKRGTFRAKAEL